MDDVGTETGRTRKKEEEEIVDRYTGITFPIRYAVYNDRYMRTFSIDLLSKIPELGLEEIRMDGLVISFVNGVEAWVKESREILASGARLTAGDLGIMLDAAQDAHILYMGNADTEDVLHRIYIRAKEVDGGASIQLRAANIMQDPRTIDRKIKRRGRDRATDTKELAKIIGFERLVKIWATLCNKVDVGDYTTKYGLQAMRLVVDFANMWEASDGGIWDIIGRRTVAPYNKALRIARIYLRQMIGDEDAIAALANTEWEIGTYNKDVVYRNRNALLPFVGMSTYARFEQYRKRLAEGSMTGSSLATKAYQTLANTYRRVACPGARLLEDGEIHPLCANWMGPGTNVDKALRYPSANAADDCARIHDMEYRMASYKKDPALRAKLIRMADEKIINCLKKTNDTPYTQLGLAGINTKMKLEDAIPQVVKLVLGKDKDKYFGKKGGCLECCGDRRLCQDRGAEIDNAVMRFPEGTFRSATAAS